MTTLRQAAQQALVALKNAIAVRNNEGGTMLVYPLEDNAINAIKEALAQPEQVDCPRCGHVCSQREWVGLTPEEVKHLYPYGRSVWGRETFEAIEKALKEKNT